MMLRFLLVTSVIAGFLMTGSTGNAQKKKGKKSDLVRQINLKGISAGPGKFGGKATKPTAIKNKEQLAKAFPKGADDIQKQVDFEKEMLLYFKWAGSGQDKITPSVKMGQGKAIIVFNYRRGLTRDLRQHQKLYAIPANAEWSVKTAPFKFKKKKQ